MQSNLKRQLHGTFQLLTLLALLPLATSLTVAPSSSAISQLALPSLVKKTNHLKAISRVLPDAANLTRKTISYAAGSALEELASAPTEVPGLDASPRFATRILGAGSKANQSIFTFYSEARPAHEKLCNGYFSHLDGWSHSWATVQLQRDTAFSDDYAPVTLEIEQLFGDHDIKKVNVNPERCRNDVSVRLRGGRALLTIRGPCQFLLDVNLQMAETDTGPLYDGPPIHTYSVFASGDLPYKPDLQSPDVLQVLPGQTPPKTFSESVLYFAPGVHELPGREPYVLLSGKTYYLSAAAWLKGPVQTQDQVRDLRILGLGVISGAHIERLDHCDVEGGNGTPEGLVTSDAVNTTIVGPTLVDFPNHHLMLYGGDDASRPNTLSDVKVVGWRANGDGVHVFSYWKVDNLFLRTQDDSLYIASMAKQVSFERITTWNDANGAAFIFTAHSGGGHTMLKDSDAIFSRSSWAFWSGGRVFSLRGLDIGESVVDVAIDGVRASDGFPTMPFLDINAAQSVVDRSLLLFHPEWFDIANGSLSLKDASLRGSASNGSAPILRTLRPMPADADIYKLPLRDASGIIAKRFGKRRAKAFVEHTVYNSAKMRKAVPASVRNVTFANIDVANFSTMREDLYEQSLPHGLLNIINASDEASIDNLRFKGITIASQPMLELVKDPTVFSVGTVGVNSVFVDDKEII